MVPCTWHRHFLSENTSAALVSSENIKDFLLNSFYFFKEFGINTNIFHSSLPICVLSSFKWHITPLHWYFWEVKLDFLAWLFSLWAISFPEVIVVKNTIYPSITSFACAPRHVVGDQVHSQVLPLQVQEQHSTKCSLNRFSFCLTKTFEFSYRTFYPSMSIQKNGSVVQDFSWHRWHQFPDLKLWSFRRLFFLQASLSLMEGYLRSHLISPNVYFNLFKTLLELILCSQVPLSSKFTNKKKCILSQSLF